MPILFVNQTAVIVVEAGLPYELELKSLLPRRYTVSLLKGLARIIREEALAQGMRSYKSVAGSKRRGQPVCPISCATLKSVRRKQRKHNLIHKHRQMPQFKYKAITASGRNKSGTIEADKRHAISQLKGKMRQILSVTEQKVSKKHLLCPQEFRSGQKKKNLLMEQPLSLPVV